MMKARYIAAAILGAAALAAFGQYDQEIRVEGKYVPEFIPQDRIGQFPNPVKFPLEKSSLAFATEGVVADFTPNAIPVTATGWNDTRILSKKCGYLDLGLGSWLESTLSAGYRIIDNEKTIFGVRLQHNSTSLWKPEISEAMSDTRMFRYDGMLGLYVAHSLGNLGSISAAADYHLGYFNYYGYNPFTTATASDAPEAPTQTLNDVAARVQWLSPSRIDDVAWNLGFGIRYFGLRRFYDNGGATSLISRPGGHETDISLTGGVSFPTSSKSSLGIDLDAHCLVYGAKESASMDYSTRSVNHSDVVPDEYLPDPYGSLALTPYYSFRRDRLDIRLGARIDLAFNARTEYDKYRTFNIAPDIKVDYNAGPVAMYLHLGGGNRLNTLAYNYSQDYYCIPALMQTAPTYSPLDARAGISFGPFSGFAAGFELAYRITQNQEMYGWYTAAINGNAAPANLGLPLEAEGLPLFYLFDTRQSSSLRGISLGLNMSYDAGRYFKIEARGTYQPQKGETGYYNGMDRPRWTASCALSSNPWSSLKLSLGCDYRGVRAFPVWANGIDMESFEESSSIYMYRVSDYFSLNFRASYDVTDWLGVWLQADNLTNRANIAAPGLPLPGIRIAAGLGLTF